MAKKKKPSVETESVESAQTEKEFSESSFSAIEVAELAATFLPSLPLGEDWPDLSPNDLQQRLSAEFAPGGKAAMSGMESYELEKEMVLDADERGLPSIFEVLAEAAVRRAKTLLEAAKEEKRTERIELEDRREAEQRQSWADESAAENGIEEFRKRFGEVGKVSLEDAAKAILPRTTDSVRSGLIDKWRGCSEKEMKRIGLFDNVDTYETHGVEYLDFYSFGLQLRQCADHFRDIVRKEIASRSGSIGGRKSQAKAKKDQAITPTADPSKPSQTPNRGG